jgi:hypothetical protein
LHQIAQRQEAQSERSDADGCNSTDRPAVNPAGCSCTDCEGDAVHGSQERDGSRSGSTDLDDDGWKARQDRVHHISHEADRRRTDQEAPEEADRPAVVPLGDFSLGRHRAPSRL